MLAIATVDPRESRGSNPRRRATTEHTEHTEVRKPEDGQPRNTQNTRKSENRKRSNHGTLRTHGSQKTGRGATTEHPEHTEDRRPEDGQPRNTQNTRKSENRKRSNHGTPRTHGRQKTGRGTTTEHTEHAEVRRSRKNSEPEKGRCGSVEGGVVSTNCSDRGPGGWQGASLFGMKNKKPPLGNPRGGFKNPAIPTFALVCTIIGSESLTTVFGMGTGDPF